MTAAIDAGRALCALLLLSFATGAGAPLRRWPKRPSPSSLSLPRGPGQSSRRPSSAARSDDELDPLDRQGLRRRNSRREPRPDTPPRSVRSVLERWSLEAEAALPPGTYTAVAEQTERRSRNGPERAGHVHDRHGRALTLAHLARGADKRLDADAPGARRDRPGRPPGDLADPSPGPHDRRPIVAEATRPKPRAEPGRRRWPRWPTGPTRPRPPRPIRRATSGTSEAVTFTSTRPAPRPASPSRPTARC